MTVIFKNMVLSNYLDEKNLKRSCGSPKKQFDLTVWINDVEQVYKWDEYDLSTDGKQMTSLAKKIINITRNTENYKLLVP